MSNPFNENIQVNPDNISYGFQTYGGFIVRTVYLKNELKGEYHLKAEEGGPLYDNLLVALMKIVGKDCEVGYVDRTGIITLEYPIYVIVKNPLLEDVMGTVWSDVEQFLKKE